MQWNEWNSIVQAYELEQEHAKWWSDRDSSMQGDGRTVIVPHHPRVHPSEVFFPRI